MKKIIASLMMAAVGGLATTGFSSVVQPDAVIVPLAYTGTTASTGVPTFDRPDVNYNTNVPEQLSGTTVAFDSLEFSVSSAGTYNFLSTDIAPVNWDNFTLLYSGSFNPASPMTNLLIGNDDLAHAGNQGVSGFSYALQTGVSYVFVTTGYYASSTGSFTDSITLSAVPEPGTWVIVGASFVGLAMMQRLRRKAA